MGLIPVTIRLELSASSVFKAHDRMKLKNLRLVPLNKDGPLHDATLSCIELERAKARARESGLNAGPVLHKPKAR